MAIKPLPRLLLIVAAVGGAWVRASTATRIATPDVAASAVPGQADVPVAADRRRRASPRS